MPRTTPHQAVRALLAAIGETEATVSEIRIQADPTSPDGVAVWVETRTGWRKSR